MSSRTILSAVLFFCLSSAVAQIGFKAGPSLSDIAFLELNQSPYLGYEVNYLVHKVPMPTFQAGAFGTFELGKRVDFQPELLFITQGLDYGTEYLYDDMTYKIKVSYIHIPLLLKYQTSLKRKWHPAVYIGPYASWRLAANRITEFEGQREKSVMANVRNADFGLAAGYSAGFDLPSGNRVEAELRCSYGLVNMMDRIEGYIPNYDEHQRAYARNVSIALLVGYRFIDLKKERQ